MQVRYIFQKMAATFENNNLPSKHVTESNGKKIRQQKHNIRTCEAIKSKYVGLFHSPVLRGHEAEVDEVDHGPAIPGCLDGGEEVPPQGFGGRLQHPFQVGAVTGLD